MFRITATSTDFQSGRIKNSVSKLRKHHPDPDAKLSAVQEMFSKLLGYGKYTELFNLAKQYGPAYLKQPLAMEQVIETVGQRIARHWSLSIEEAKSIAATLHLEHLDACRSTARPFPPSALRTDLLRPAVHVANLGLAALSPSDLISLGAPGFSYAISGVDETFIWDNLVAAVDQLRPEVLEALKSQPQFAAFTDMSALREAYVRDVLIPASRKPLLDAVRQHELVPLGYEVISLFNEVGVFRGRSLINRQIRGLVPVLSRDDGLFDAMAALLCDRAPQHSGIVRNVKPGDGKGRLVSFATDGGGFVVYDHVDNERPRATGRTYVEYHGAEQMFALAPEAKHHEAEISRLVSKGLADFVKMSPADLLPVEGVVLDDGRFPSDVMDIHPGPVTVDGQLRPRSAKSDQLSGPSFYERQITYIRLHDWLTVDDLPPLVLPSIGIPSVKVEADHMMTEAIPRYRRELHYQFEESVKDATHQAQRLIASNAGIQKVLDLAQRFSTPEQINVRIAQVITPVVMQRISHQKLIAAGQLTKDVMPELEEYEDYVIGVALAMSTDSYSVKEPGIRDYRAKADLLSWLAIFSIQTNDTARKTARFTEQTRALLISGVLMNGLKAEDVVSEGSALMAFLGKLADEDRYIVDVKKWRDETARRWSAARKHRCRAVGAMIDDKAHDAYDLSTSDAPTARVTYKIQQEAEDQYHIDPQQ